MHPAVNISTITSLTVTVSNKFSGKVVLFMLVVMGGLEGASVVAVVGAD